MKRNIIIFLLIFFVFQLGWAEAFSKDENKEYFEKAAIAYKEGKYAEAIQMYENILSNGMEGGNLYFNLGNSYYKEGNIGKARLYYERALRFIPRDRDLQYNYRFLLSIIEEEEYDNNNFRSKILWGLLADFTLNELIVGILLLSLLFFVISFLCLYYGWPLKVRWLLSLLFLGFFIFALLGATIKKDLKDYAVTIRPSKSLFEPKENSTIHFNLFEGAKVKMLSREGGWVKIRRMDGKVGWVQKDSIETIIEERN